MPLYQMLCITKHFAEYAQIRELVKQTCTHLFDKGGVVRSLDYMGTQPLPQRMKRHGQAGEYAYKGDYWAIHFDTSPRTVRTLEHIMRMDPRVLRWTVVRLAAKPEESAKWGRILQQNSTPHTNDIKVQV